VEGPSPPIKVRDRFPEITFTVLWSLSKCINEQSDLWTVTSSDVFNWQPMSSRYVRPQCRRCWLADSKHEPFSLQGESCGACVNTPRGMHLFYDAKAFHFALSILQSYRTYRINTKAEIII